MKRLLTLAFIFTSSFSLFSNAEVADWQLEAEDEDLNIKVYTRVVPGSSLKEFKGVTTVQADINTLVAVLKDSDAAMDWMHNIVQFDVKEESSEVESVVYTVSATPWPVTNRDSYVRSVLSAEPNGVVTSKITAVPEFGPKDDDYVRMPSLEGGWVFTPKDGGSVEVVYQVHADPGGSLPDWLVNAIVVETPLETLKNLHIMVHKPEYQNKTFGFISTTKIANQ